MKTYETSDFYLACFLRCTGYPLVDVRRDSARFAFVFEQRQDPHADVMGFYNNNRTVRPIDFVEAIKSLKSLMHRR